MTSSIGDAAQELGVSVKTLRRWADSGKIKSVRSPSGQRRFNLLDIKRITPRDLKELDTRITLRFYRKNENWYVAATTGMASGINLINFHAFEQDKPVEVSCTN
ncbi:hypothetical protein CAL7716_100340 (plasmid) [Calothrix sp. PCC 7716]|nr:hypothetical protein CAL7716_100340 [Calothrix sp. PCC 7716]